MSQAEIRGLSLHLGLPCGTEAQAIWAIFCYLSKYIIKELDQKCNNKDLERVITCDASIASSDLTTEPQNQHSCQRVRMLPHECCSQNVSLTIITKIFPYIIHLDKLHHSLVGKVYYRREEENQTLQEKVEGVQVSV